MTTLTRLTEMHSDVCDSTTRVIIAREGTELANTLRTSGWVARAGWRSMTSSGEAVWHLRFEIVSDNE